MSLDMPVALTHHSNKFREIFVIYSHPTDYPEHFVIRRWVTTSNLSGFVPDPDWFKLGQSLEDVRAYVPPFCVRLERNPRDEPHIVECWI